MSNFNIHDWRFNNLLKEGKDEKPKFADFEYRVALLFKPGEKTEKEIRNYARVPFRKAIDAWEAGRPWEHFLPKTLPDFTNMWNNRNVKEAKKKDPIRRELDSETGLEPLPKEWYSKYYTVDFYMDGPRYFVNKTGEEVDYMDIVNHYEKETGKSIVDLFKEVDEAKKKDPVRRDTEEEREGLRQAGIRTTEKTFTDRKARQKRGYEKHKGVRYEEAVQEAVRKLEESRKQKQSS